MDLNKNCDHRQITSRLLLSPTLLILVYAFLSSAAIMWNGPSYGINLDQRFPERKRITFPQLLTEATTFTSTTPTASSSPTTSVTPTGTITPTISGTPTSTASPTITATITYTPSASPSRTNTFTQTPATGTVTVSLSATTQITSQIETVSPTLVITPETALASATLIPLPEVTYQFPQAITTAELMIIEHSEDVPELSKGVGWLGFKQLLRMWPLLLVLLLWLVLGLWFVLTQIYFKRD